MGKEREILYLKNIGEDGIKHAVNKPFSDESCGNYLAEMGAIMSLLPPPPAKLLDLGCGTGWTSCFFARRGYEVTGQDISEDMICYANLNKDKEELDNLHFIAGDYEGMDFSCEFNCAVFFDSLHHSLNEEDAIRMVYKALKPGGICVTSEPGLGHEVNPGTIDAVRKYNVIERDMPPEKIIHAGKKAGFTIFKVYPHALQLNALVYDRQLGHVGPPQRRSLKRLLRTKILNRLAPILGIAQSCFDTHDNGVLVEIHNIMANKQYNGITVMVK
ncbi:MAG: class I SAM-dependent methyltransferase [Actinobacteria bacterium]|nr:class I SAM-dependent methyltransferase [Actinomycetota bacterium]